MAAGKSTGKGAAAKGAAKAAAAAEEAAAVVAAEAVEAAEAADEPLGLPPVQLRHYYERIDVHEGANAFCANQAKNALTRLNELYAGKCHRGVFFERVHAMDDDTADQPCVFMPDNPNGLAQISVGYTARVRYYSAGDVVTGVVVRGADQGFVLGERPGYAHAAIQGTVAGALRVGQTVALRLTHVYFSHGERPGVAGDVLSARAPVPTYFVEEDNARLTPADFAALEPLVARVRAAAAWIDAHRKVERVAQFIAMYGAPTGAASAASGKGPKAPKPFVLEEYAAAATGAAALPPGVWKSGGVAPVALPAASATGPVPSEEEPRALPAGRVLAELLLERARMCETIRALSVEFADAAAFDEHSNVWRATRA